MTRKVLILDTSVLCCWLRVPGRETAGSGEERWTPEKVDAFIREEEANGSTLVLPIASLIETGNHIAQAPSARFECAEKLADCLKAAIEERSPWAAFTAQSPMWEKAHLAQLARSWPGLAAGGTSIGDATIKDVAEYYARAGYDVEILTGDAGLKAYEPERKPAPLPRRRLSGRR